MTPPVTRQFWTRPFVNTPSVKSPLASLLTAGMLALGALVLPAGLALGGAPAAQAEPLPVPDPVPVPEPEVSGEQVQPPVSVGGETRVSAPSVQSSYEDPLRTVPNINGDPCTGAWESTVCYAMNFDSAPAVQPRSTVSSSP